MSSGSFGERDPGDGSALWSGLRVLRERWWVILLTAVLCVAIALATALTADEEYESEAQLLIVPSALAGIVDPSAADSTDPERQLSTSLLLVRSTTVAERVRDRLRLRESAEDLAARVDAEAVPEADLITITATAGNPGTAARLANTFADEFVASGRERDRKRIREGEALLQQQINALAPNDPRRGQLAETLSDVRQLATITTGNAEQVQEAVPSTVASSPTPRRDAIVALVLGVAVGLGLAFLLDLLDRRVKTVEDFEGLYGVRALASVPQRTGSGKTRRDRAIALEPFRILRNALGFLAVGRPIRVVLVTSAVPGEGKTTVAAGLARAAAQSGQAVVLVETDLRRPTFQRQFDLGTDTRGLTTALVGGVAPSELARRVLPGLPTLSVLPAGPLPPNAAELLRSTEMGRLLGELAADADLVVLDAPPLLPVADAHVLLDHPQIDACLVVSRAYKTQRQDVRRARAILDRHRLANLGLVVNGLREDDGAYDYYMADDDDRNAAPVTDGAKGSRSAGAAPTRRA